MRAAVLRVFEVQPGEQHRDRRRRHRRPGRGDGGQGGPGEDVSWSIATKDELNSPEYGATDNYLPADELGAAILGVTGDGSDYMLDLTGNA